MRRMRFAAAASLAMALLVAPARAAEGQAKAGDVIVSDVWSRALPAVSTTGAAYMTLTNDGRAPDRLLRVSSPAAERAELHTHLNDDGVVRMRPVSAIEVEPGSSIVLAPGGLHVMLFGLKQPLAAGTRFPLRLTFERGGEVEVIVQVRGAGAPAHGHGGSHGHGARPSH